MPQQAENKIIDCNSIISSVRENKSGTYLFYFKSMDEIQNSLTENKSD